MWIYLFEFVLEIFEDKKLDPSKTNKILGDDDKNSKKNTKKENKSKSKSKKK